MQKLLCMFCLYLPKWQCIKIFINYKWIILKNSNKLLTIIIFKVHYFVSDRGLTIPEAKECVKDRRESGDVLLGET